MGVDSYRITCDDLDITNVSRRTFGSWNENGLSCFDVDLY